MTSVPRFSGARGRLKRRWPRGCAGKGELLLAVQAVALNSLAERKARLRVIKVEAAPLKYCNNIDSPRKLTIPLAFDPWKVA